MEKNMSKESLMPSEQFEQLIKENFDEHDWTEEIAQEFNCETFDDLIFRFEEKSNDYPYFIPEELSKEILDAFDRAQREEEGKEPALIQCENCDSVFAGECFEMHVCTNNIDKAPILPTIIREMKEETAFQKLSRYTMTLIRENAESINRFVKGRLNSAPHSNLSNADSLAKQSNQECFVCNRKFVHESGLYRHYDKHIGEMMPPTNEVSNRLHPVVLCVFCGQIFTLEYQAWNHFTQHHVEIEGKDTILKFLSSELQYEINDYKAEPQESVKLKERKSSYTIAEPNALEEAASTEKVYVQEQENFAVNDFLRLIYVQKLYQCECCDAVFSNKKSLLSHVSKHDPSTFLACNTCDLYFLSLKDMLLHIHQECLNFHDFRNALKDIPRVWLCNVCNEEFLGLEHLVLHRHQNFHFFPRMNEQQSNLIFPCEICTTTYDDANSLVIHLQERHLKKARMPNTPETSTRIPKSPTAVPKGGGHQTSTRPRIYLCEVCGKSYTQSSHLWQHLRFHQGIKPFACPHDNCGRRFTIRPDLNDHIRKCHTGERPYECTICGKRFLTGSVYYQHRLIHRGERRYGCEDCGKRFYRADALKNHTRIHSGEKPYKCWVPLCTKSFRQRGDRDKHVKARHKNAPQMPSPKRKKVFSFGLGRTKNNQNLYCARPGEIIAPTSSNVIDFTA